MDSKKYTIADYKFNPNSGQYRGECPFREKHPDGSGQDSFFISPEKNAFHCFSCNHHGSAYSVLRDKLNMDSSGIHSIISLQVSNLALSAHNVAKKAYEMDFMYSTKPPKLFLDRGYSAEVLKKFQIGSIIDSHIKKETTVIPQHSNLGELLGFYFRLPNYVDFRGKDKKSTWSTKSLPTETYLYGASLIKNPKEVKILYVTDSITDTLTLWDWGYYGVSLLGSNISGIQSKYLSQFETVVFIADRDLAGFSQAEELYKKIGHTVNYYVALLSEKDVSLQSKKEFEVIASRVLVFPLFKMTRTIEMLKSKF